MPTIKQLDWSKHQPDQTHTRKPAYDFKRFGKSASKGNKVKAKMLHYNHEKNTSTPPQKN